MRRINYLATSVCAISIGLATITRVDAQPKVVSKAAPGKGVSAKRGSTKTTAKTKPAAPSDKDGASGGGTSEGGADEGRSAQEKAEKEAQDGAAAKDGSGSAEAPASTMSVESCVTSHAKGQREARGGSLREAQKLFTACGHEACPSQLRTDCARFLRETSDKLPTVVFLARSAEGADLTDVKVYSGNELLVDGLTGRAVALEPGRHSFRFVLKDGKVIKQDALINEGEKARSILAQQPSPVKPKAAPAGQTPASSSPVTTQPGPIPTMFWVGVAVTGIGLAGFTGFGLAGRSEENSLEKGCSPNCTLGDQSLMRNMYLAADISLITAGVGALVATVFLLLPKGEVPVARAATATGVLPRRDLWKDWKLSVGYHPTPEGGKHGFAAVYGQF